MPLAIIYFAGNHCVGVSTPQIIAEVRQSILYLNSSKISMVDAGHIKQQARVSHCPDFKFNCESENQTSKKMDAKKKKIFKVDKLSVDKITHFTFLHSSNKTLQLVNYFTCPSELRKII